MKTRKMSPNFYLSYKPENLKQLNQKILIFNRALSNKLGK